MLAEIFYWILNMSIIGSVMGLIVLPLRKIPFLSRRMAVILWVIPFVRLCVPFGLNAKYSLMSLISLIPTRTVTVLEPAESISVSAMNSVLAAESYFPMTFKSEALANVFAVSGVIWLIGACAVILALAIMYFMTLGELKDARLLRENIYLSDKVTSPAVYGIFRPRIVLPSSYEDKDITHILSHERAHIRRADNLWRMLGFLTGAVHWFNPLSWLFLKRFLADIELACDDAALKDSSDEERREYARELLGCAESKSLLTSAFGGAKVRSRIENIVSYKRMTAVSAVFSVILIAALLIVTLTNSA